MLYNNIKEDVENKLSTKEEPNYDGYVVSDEEYGVSDDEMYSGSDSDSETNSITNSIVDVEKTNPVYDNVRYDYSLYTDYSDNEFCDLFNYKQKTEKNNKEILDSIKLEEDMLDGRYERAYTIREKINFYWIGLTDNVIHKRNYLKYNEKILGLTEKADYIHKRLDVLKERRVMDQKEENQIILDIEGIFKLLNEVLVNSIIFMCNAKAPIGDFIDFYTETKNNILMLTNIKENKLFISRRCSIEIKHGKKDVIKNIKKKYDEEQSTDFAFLDKEPPKKMVEFSKRFANELEMDKKYIRKDYLLESMKYILDENIMNRGKNNLKYQFIRYKKRQEVYYEHIEKLFILNRLYKETEISNLRDNQIENNRDNLIENYIDYMKKKLNIIDENIKHEEENVITKEYTDEIEKLLSTIGRNQGYERDVRISDYMTLFSRKELFWKEYNIRILNDILEVTGMFEKSYKLGEETKKYLLELEIKIKKSLEIEKKVEEEIIKIRKSILKKGEILFKKYEKMDEPLSNVYSEREIWWYYYRYDILNRRLEKDKKITDKESHKNNEIRNFSFARNYRFEINPAGPNGGSRPVLPLNRGVIWLDMDDNKDRIEYSKRQQIYKKYLMSNLSEEEMEEQKEIEVREGVKDLIRIEMLIENIRKTQDIFNELLTMGDFIKDGVLINDQLFFKFILFGINVLIFIGQYFWTEHIEPSM